MTNSLTLDQCRLFYSEEIRFTGNVQSPALVEAFARVPREKFLGPGPWEIASAEIRETQASYQGIASAIPHLPQKQTPLQGPGVDI
jgi:protein-L-isoaspartate O-methyltransferase